MAARAVPLESVAAGYASFVDAYGALVDAPGEAAPETALGFRLLLVSDYRRLVLADPGLPPDLLPDRWPGGEARAAAAALFQRVATPSEARLQQLCETLDGPMPPPAPELDHRFS